MKTWQLPLRPGALIFDLDSTLYTNPAYARFQTEVLVERLAVFRGEALEDTQALLSGLRAERRSRGEADTSLGNLFLALGIPIGTSVAWREELIDPHRWLGPDARLAASLATLADRLPLCLVTNNPRSIGLASLEALGLAASFSFVIGLDDTLRSKPDPAPFRLALSRLGLAAASIVSIGDREDVDIRPALELGMGAIMVESVEELHSLRSLLFPARNP
ncbi:MAG TPA: HAD family hydrolase [Rectinemataceae bacterium]|nr:HAD family hydrolase [Rectinemataceae bacterium]